MEIGREEGKERGTLWVLEKEKLERKGGRSRRAGKKSRNSPRGEEAAKGSRGRDERRWSTAQGQWC